MAKIQELGISPLQETKADRPEQVMTSEGGKETKSFAEVRSRGEERLDRAVDKVKSWKGKLGGGISGLFSRIKNAGKEAATWTLAAPELTKEIGLKAARGSKELAQAIGKDVSESARETWGNIKEGTSEAKRQIVEGAIDKVKAAEAGAMGSVLKFEARAQKVVAEREKVLAERAGEDAAMLEINRILEAQAALQMRLLTLMKLKGIKTNEAAAA